jgi:cytochrome b involved in lipid metabolism
MRRLTFAGFVAFWAFAATLLTLAALEPETASARDGIGVVTYSLADVAEHGDRDSCWMAIEGKVYDLTSYLDRHPTPVSVLLTWCGRDATIGMRTKGYGRDHSRAAWENLEQYAIGVLDSD